MPPPTRVPLGVRGASDAAGQSPVGRALGALAAARQEGHDHTRAEGQVVDAVADLLDDAGGLVAEQYGRRAHAVAVDDAEVGMADAGGLDAHQDLAGAGGRQVEIVHRKRPGFGVRPAKTDLFEYGATDPHGYQTAVTARLLP